MHRFIHWVLSCPRTGGYLPRPRFPATYRCCQIHSRMGFLMAVVVVGESGLETGF